MHQGLAFVLLRTNKKNIKVYLSGFLYKFSSEILTLRYKDMKLFFQLIFQFDYKIAKILLFLSFYFFLMYFMYFLALKLSSTSSRILTFLRGLRASRRALRSASVSVLKSKGNWKWNYYYYLLEYKNSKYISMVIKNH